MFVLRHFKTRNSVIYQRQSNKKPFWDAVRTFTAANFTEDDKYQHVLEEMKEFGRVPSLDSISPYHWKEIVQLPTKSARRKYFEYLWLTETRKEHKRQKQTEKQPEVVETPRDSRLFLHRHFPDAVINRFYNNSLIRAMLFGQKLIIDCSYEDQMTQRESSSTAEQLKRVFSANREHNDPFDIHFCDVNPQGKVITSLAHRIPTLFNPDFPINFHEDSYLEKFRSHKRNFVYLTPDSDKLLEFNHDDIYIVGALVDRTKHLPYSFDKAKEERLRTAKLPLDEYISRGGQEKCLTLNQVVSILLDLKSSVDMRVAFDRHIPKRKVKGPKVEYKSPNACLKKFRDSRLFSDMWGGNRMLKNFKKDMKNLHYLKKRLPKETIDLP